MNPTQPSPAPYQPQMTPATPPSFPSPQVPKQGMWKMPVAILIGVLVLAGGAYAWMKRAPAMPIAQVTPSPTPDPTAGWKTYQNEEYGFQFRYPRRVLLELSYLGECSETLRIKLESVEETLVVSDWWVTPKQITPSCIDLNEGVVGGAPIVSSSNENVIIGGRSIEKNSTITGNIPNAESLFYRFQSDLFNYEVMIHAFYSNNSDLNITEMVRPEAEQLTEQILSTFKFTK